MGVFDNIISVFENETSFKRISDANSAVKDQQDIWSDTINKLIVSLSKNNPEIKTTYLEAIRSYLSNTKESFSVSETDSGYVLSGELPLITKIGSSLDNFIARNPVTMYGIVYAESSDIRRHLKESSDVADPVVMLAGAYTAFREFGSSINELSRKINDISTRDTASSNEVFSKITNRSNEIIDKAIRDLQEFETKTRDIEQKHREDMAKFMESAKNQIEAAKKLAFESEALKTARSIWNNKTNKHRVSYGSGLAIIILTISLMLIAILYNVDAIQRFIASFQKADKEVPYGVIVLVLVPILGVAWILKIINKFASNNLALAEDAEHREAMLDTYFRLVGNPDAKMEPADRIIVLNAIFRPLPGQQQEDLNPPNLVDMISSATSKNK